MIASLTRLSPMGREAFEAILVVLLHHGGRVEQPALAAILLETGAPPEALREALIRGHAVGFWDELGSTVILCRSGWNYLAARAPHPAALGRLRRFPGSCDQADLAHGEAPCGVCPPCKTRRTT